MGSIGRLAVKEFDGFSPAVDAVGDGCCWAMNWVVTDGLAPIPIVLGSFSDGGGFDGPWAPKVVHVLFFFFLCLFLNRALRNQQGSPFFARWSLPMSIVICLMFGTLDEVHQMFVAGRHPRVTDVLLDLTGATLMAVTLWVWDRRQCVRRERITP